MSYWTRTQLKDQYGWAVECTPMDELRVVEPVRLVGSTFVGTTVDSNFWITTGTGGTTGTTTQLNGAAILATGTNAAGAAVIQTNRRARYTGASANRFRAQIQMSAGVASNVRKWGMFDGETGAAGTATNGAYFKLDGTAMSVCTLKDGTETAVASASWSNSTTTPTITDINSYEIYITNAKVYFVIAGVLKHTASFPSATWSQTLTLPARASSINAGSTTDCTLTIRVMTTSRLGKQNTVPTSYYFASGQTAGVPLKLGPGNLHSVVFGGAANNAVVTLADSTSAATPAIWVYNATGALASPVSVDFDGLPFKDGLRLVVTTGNASMTVIYE